MATPERRQASGPPPEGRHSPAGRILANTSYRAIADIGGKAATLVLYVVLARAVGDAQFGVYSFALSFVGLVTVLGALGQDFLLTREVARDHSRVHEYFSNTLALRIVLMVPLLLAAIAIASSTGFDSQTRLLALLLGFGMIAEHLTSTCYAAFQAFERLGFIPVVLISQRWATALGGIAALALGAGIEVVAAIYCASVALGFALAVTLLSRYVVRIRAVVDWRRWWPLLRQSAVIGVVAISAQMLLRIDTAILAGFESDAVVGQYAAAYRLFEGTIFIGMSVSAAVIPVFSRLSPRGDPPLRPVFERAMKLVVALCLPLTIAALVLAEPLVVLAYGEPFRPGGSALALLAPTIVLFAVSVIASDLLIAQYRQVAVAIAFTIVLIVNVVLNVVLIPPLSLDGSAIAMSAAEVLAAGSVLVLAARLVGGVDWRRMLAGTLVAGALAAAVMVALRGLPAVALALGALAYLGVLVAFERRVYPEDAAAIRELLRRGPSPTPD